MKYEGIGFNGEFLSALPFEQFVIEVKGALPDEAKQKELYELITEKYGEPKAVKLTNKKDGIDQKSLEQSSEVQSGTGSEG